MKAWVVRTGRRIEPLGLAPGDCLILDRSLDRWREQNLAPLGLETHPAAPDQQLRGPALVMSDSVVPAPRLVKRFLRQARDRGGDARLALRPCRFLEETSPLSSLEHFDTDGGEAWGTELAYISGEGPADQAWKAPPLALEIEEKRLPLELLSRWTGEPEETGLTIEGLIQVEHWAHVLDANRLALAIRWFDLTPRKVLRYLTTLLRAHSLRKRKIGMKAWWAGKGCDVHPTAVLEGVILGNGVKIGPRATLMGSVVGDGAEIQAGAVVNFSSLGVETVVSPQGSVILSVLMDRAFVGNTTVQYSVLAPGSAILTGSYLIDTRLAPGRLENVRVRVGEEIVDSGRRLLGGALGPDAVVGTGVWVAAGREIPAGALVVASPDRVVARVPRHAPPGRLLQVRDGELRPLEG